MSANANVTYLIGVCVMLRFQGKSVEQSLEICCPSDARQAAALRTMLELL